MNWGSWLTIALVIVAGIIGWIKERKKKELAMSKTAEEIAEEVASIYPLSIRTRIASAIRAARIEGAATRQAEIVGLLEVYERDHPDSEVRDTCTRLKRKIEERQP